MTAKIQSNHAQLIFIKSSVSILHIFAIYLMLFVYVGMNHHVHAMTEHVTMASM